MFKDILPYVEGRLDCQSQFRHDAQRTDSDDSSAKTGVPSANELKHTAVGCYHLQRGNRRCEIAVSLAGPMRRGGAGADYRYVWKRSQVVQGEAFALQIPAEFAVPNASLHRYTQVFAIQLDNAVEILQGDVFGLRVGDGVEAMSRSDRFQSVGARDNLLNISGR